MSAGTSRPCCSRSTAECHSSLAPQGVNAVEYAAELIAFMKSMARRIQADGPFDDAYDVPHTTVHAGVIHGGTAINIVPKDCWFDFEIRHLPADDPEALIGAIKAHAESALAPEMHAVDPDTGFATEIDLGGVIVPTGDGLVLRGKTLYVVQNFANAIAVFTLSPDYSAATRTRVLTDSDLRIPATADLFGPWLYATNARFDVCFPGMCDPSVFDFDIVRVDQ